LVTESLLFLASHDGPAETGAGNHADAKEEREKEDADVAEPE
jgi:hypothetical protein